MNFFCSVNSLIRWCRSVAFRCSRTNVPAFGAHLLPLAPGALQVLVAVAFDGLDDAVPAHRLLPFELPCPFLSPVEREAQSSRTPWSRMANAQPPDFDRFRRARRGVGHDEKPQPVANRRSCRRLADRKAIEVGRLARPRCAAKVVALQRISR